MGNLKKYIWLIVGIILGIIWGVLPILELLILTILCGMSDVQVNMLGGCGGITDKMIEDNLLSYIYYGSLLVSMKFYGILKLLLDFIFQPLMDLSNIFVIIFLVLWLLIFAISIATHFMLSILVCCSITYTLQRIISFIMARFQLRKS